MRSLGAVGVSGVVHGLGMEWDSSIRLCSRVGTAMDLPVLQGGGEGLIEQAPNLRRTDGAQLRLVAEARMKRRPHRRQCRPKGRRTAG